MQNIYFQKSYQRGFGTYPLRGAELSAAMEAAMDIGYRAFDCAQMYGNEEDVGSALACANVPRSELCITTKVHPDNFSEERFLPSVHASLKALRLDYVDALLLHWPPVGGDVAPSLRLLEKAQSEGLARSIGVSNYTASMMRAARKIVSTPLVTNQVEFHPLLDQSALLKAAVETGIPLSSYCSVARGEVFKHAIFTEIASNYGKQPAQIVLRWILQKGVAINTMSAKPANIAANFNVMDFTLSSLDMARIDAMTAIGYRIIKKGLLPWTPAWD
ncbi:MAG TPA: aldo/keto reductase [Roseiarcus sp.]|nr:aldo/keto reductase [Roseiarcus sp.]